MLEMGGYVTTQFSDRTGSERGWDSLSALCNAVVFESF